MTYIEAALEALSRAKQPLSTREVTERAISNGLLRTTGKTPEASMSVALYKEAASKLPRVQKLSRPGASRAVRGSVRWTLVDR